MRRNEITRADTSTAGTLHDVILAEIKGMVLSGTWPPGHRLPIETDLAAKYRCSRMTVNKVLSQLARDGLIERRKKAGSFVSVPRSQSALLEIRDIKEDVESLGRTYRYERLMRSIRQSTAVDQKRLRLTGRTEVLAISSLHRAGASPFCFEDRVINIATVPAAAAVPFTDAAPGPWLVAHVPWTEAEHRIRAVAADDRVAKVLAVPRGAPCLVVERFTERAGNPITHVTFTYPGAAQELIARFTPSRS